MLSPNSSQQVGVLARDTCPEAFIHLKAVSKRFAAIQAVNDLSLSINGGDIYGLLGPNGAGKSTTINLICGFLRPTEGSILVRGSDIVTDPLTAKRSLGVVPQELALYTELTARQNLRFFGRLYGLNRRRLESRIDQLLAMMQLEDRDKDLVGSFSGGMQRRLNIAAALLHQPAVVLMDEPTVGLDPQNRENILDIVQSIAADGTAVLYSTHYMEEVERICTRIGIIDHGRLLTEGSLVELMRQSGGRQTLTLRGVFDESAARSAFALAPGETMLKCSPEMIVLNLAGAEGRLPSLLGQASSAGEVREVSMNRQSLESLFIQLTGRELRE